MKVVTITMLRVKGALRKSIVEDIPQDVIRDFVFDVGGRITSSKADLVSHKRSHQK